MIKIRSKKKKSQITGCGDGEGRLITKGTLRVDGTDLSCVYRYIHLSKFKEMSVKCVTIIVCKLCFGKLGGGHGNPLQYSCLENPMDRGTL